MKRILAVGDEPDLPRSPPPRCAGEKARFAFVPKPFDLNDMNHTAA